MQVVCLAGWERHTWLRHGFSTRPGGVSTCYSAGVRGELNLGWTKEDEAGNVLQNRRRFAEEVAGGSAHLVGLRQIHSAKIHVVETDAEPLATAEGRPVLEGDGLMTQVPGLLLGVGVADCVPVLVADVEQRAVAAFHAGWRGTLARIVEQGIAQMHRQYGSQPENLIAAIGPSIGPCCYSVGEEVRSAFHSQFAYAPQLFSAPDRSDPAQARQQLHLDLWEANRRQLLDAGLSAASITMVGECTACTRIQGRRKYFSHRYENGSTGRMMGAIGISE